MVLLGNDVDLGILPISHHAELDPERYITISMTVRKDSDTGIPHVGIYRHEATGKDRLACRMRLPHYGADIANKNYPGKRCEAKFEAQ